MLRSHVLVAFAGLAALLCASRLQAHELNAPQDAAQSMEQAREDLQRGRLDRAELLLERVLMLQPENAEARVELALLMARRGQVDAARGLLQGLRDDPRTPAEYRDRLNTLRSGLAVASRPGTASSGQGARQDAAAAPLDNAQRPAAEEAPVWRAEASLAWSSNPMARTALSDVTFTTPDGPVQVPLSSRPQPGALAGLGLARLGGSSGFELHLQEAAVAGAQPSVRLMGWGAVPSAWMSPGMKSTTSLLQWNMQAQQGLDGSRRAMAGLSLVSGRWRGALHHYLEPTMDDRGHLFRLDLQVVDHPKLQVAVYGERSASSARDQGSVRAGWHAQWLPGAGWRAQLLWQAQHDLQGYNPLLANGAARRLWSVQGSVERNVPIGADKMLSFRALATQRQSNIELFGFSEAALQISLVRLWR